jgi:hypothetical protein
MTIERFKLTTSKLPKGATVVPGETVARFNKRLSEAMKDIDRDFRRKQCASADKASKIILNA